MKNYKKLTEFKRVEDLENYIKEQNISLGLAKENFAVAAAKEYKNDNYTIGNRFAVLPMEGWDCEKDGSPSALTRRRWLRFATSGAKLIYGTEAAAVMHTGRSNPNQLWIAPHTVGKIKELVTEMRQVHKEKFGRNDDLRIGLQLTHSGRYSHPNKSDVLEPVTAYSNPLLDKKFHCSKDNVASDEEIKKISAAFVEAAILAKEAGFDFIDFKHAHGYFAHELLSAIDRPGIYGGSFENRTRFFRETAAEIKKRVPDLEISARLSIFDIIPYEKGPNSYGKPMDWDQEKYPYAFGSDITGRQMDENLTEVVKFVKVLQDAGVKLICATIGSPYYNVHMQRPAYYPVCDGYLPMEDPLYNVSRHIKAVAKLKELCPDIAIVGSGYTALQEFFPHAATYALENNLADFIGLGRMMISYPEIFSDILEGKELNRRLICRTFGDCTNAPRNGLVSGCYPLDHFYKEMPECACLKAIKEKNKKA